MATVAEIDKKIEGHQALIEKLREERKAAAARERKQTRRWRGMCLAAIGETVVRAIGCDWAELDLDGLNEALHDIGSDLLSGAVIDGRSPAEAKKALDAFKRPRKSDEPETGGGEAATQEGTDEGSLPEDDTAGAHQDRPW